MSDFGSGLEKCGPMHERSGHATKADLRRRIAEMEDGGTAYDAGYQAAKADMEERVYRAEAALAERDRTIERLKCCGNCGHDQAADDCCDDCTANESFWIARAEEGSE